MGLFDDILHDVGETVAAVAAHPPPVLHAAVQTAARALLGQPEARQNTPPEGTLRRYRQYVGLDCVYDFQNEAFARILRVGTLPRFFGEQPSADDH